MYTFVLDLSGAFYFAHPEVGNNVPPYLYIYTYICIYTYIYFQPC